MVHFFVRGLTRPGHNLYFEHTLQFVQKMDGEIQTYQVNNSDRVAGGVTRSRWSHPVSIEPKEQLSFSCVCIEDWFAIRPLERRKKGAVPDVVILSGGGARIHSVHSMISSMLGYCSRVLIHIQMLCCEYIVGRLP